MITISPGHWRVGSGAADLIDEVTEARKVVNNVIEYLRSSKIPVNHIEDNVSQNQQQNLKYLVTEHNKTKRKLDVSVHFNAAARSAKGKGVEVLYYDQKELASNVSKAISDVSGLINRGAKERKELAFLNGTEKPAILIEVCFVSSEVDVALYRRDFDKICRAIANELAVYVGANIKGDEITVGQYEELKQEIAELKAELARKADYNSELPVSADFETVWNWMKENGMTNGSNPRGALTRQQFAAMLHNYHQNVK